MYCSKILCLLFMKNDLHHPASDLIFDKKSTPDENIVNSTRNDLTLTSHQRNFLFNLNR